MTVDRQTARTRSSLRRALLELIQEKDYDRITIQEIVDRADVGRTTFYAHFGHKDDLLAARDRNGASLWERPRSAEGDDASAFSVVGLFRHAAENAHLFPALRHTGGLRVVENAFRQRLDRRWTAWLEQERPDLEEVERVRRARFLTGGLITWLFDWLRDGMPRSPEDMDAEFAPLADAVLRGGQIPDSVRKGTDAAD